MQNRQDNEVREFLRSLIVALPAYNEEASLRFTVEAVRKALPDVAILVVNDGSLDYTAPLARSLGVLLLDMAHNVGVGPAMQAVFQYAAHNGYRSVLRMDADGQHPPSEAIKLIKKRLETDADLVVGSRFGNGKDCISSHFRTSGVRGLAFFLSRICRIRISDPTSGFWLVSSPLLQYFAKEFPTDYPEPEGIALMRRLGYSYAEVPVVFSERKHGKSTIGALDTVYFIIKVGMALVVDRVRSMNPHYSRRHLVKSIKLYGDSPQSGLMETKEPNHD